MRLVRIRSNAPWMRNVAVASCMALTFGVFSAGAAGASTTPPIGSLTCGVTGNASLKPGLPGPGQMATTGWTMEKIHQVALTSCDVTGVTGGKATITGGVMSVNARLNQGASCDALSTSVGSVNKAIVTVKLTITTTTTTTDPITGITTTTTQTHTAAVVRVKSVSVVPSGNGADVTGTIQNSSSGNKPFGGEVFEAHLNVNNAADCASGTPLTSVDLTGSTISIHP